MDYFIADLHFGHSNIISLCSRPYNSVEEMDEAFINAWNSKVKKKADTVYIVGDFAWEKADALKYVKRLNGRKVLIIGNHDKKWLAKGDYSEYFERVTPYLEITSGNVDITLCHYPMLEWKSSRKLGSKKLGYLIHGHIHNRYSEEYKGLFVTPHALNAGVDVNGFVPVTFAELIKNNEKYKLSKLTSMVDKAEFLAFKYHLYQLDKSGRPYIEHPRIVSKNVTGEKEKVVALLHDVLEDTDIDVSLLRNTFPEKIVNAIITLTRRVGEDYFEYIKRVAFNPIAKRVKKADLRHNTDLTRLKRVGEEELARVEKYKTALQLLDEFSDTENDYDAKVCRSESVIDNKAKTYFKIIGNFAPEEITKTLNLTPSETWSKGDKRRVGNGVYEFSCWKFGRIEKVNNVFVDEQMVQTVKPLYGKIKILKELKQTYNLDFVLEVVPKFYTVNNTPILSPPKEVIDFCSMVGATFDIDYYLCIDNN